MCKVAQINVSRGNHVRRAHVEKSAHQPSGNRIILRRAEYYALVKAGSIGLGVKAVAGEMGIQFQGPTEVNADASAA